MAESDRVHFHKLTNAKAFRAALILSGGVHGFLHSPDSGRGRKPANDPQGRNAPESIPISWGYFGIGEFAGECRCPASMAGRVH